MDSKVSVYVVTHKEFIPPKEHIYIPIQVGKMFTHNNLPFLTDDTGDNITEKNKNYCELTALYWIWKNDCSDIVGVCHYRRYFSKSKIFGWEKLFLNRNTIIKYLRNFDIIVPARQRNTQSVSDYYAFCDGRAKDLVTTRRIIEKNCPEYIDDYDSFMSQNEAFYCNMMISRKEIFNKYCEWLFPLLFEIEKNTNLTDYSPVEARIFGYISELLLNVWVKHNNLRIKYCNLVNIEESVRYRFFKSVLKNLLNGRK